MAERYRLSRIPKRDQTAGAEVWEEVDGSIVQYVNGDPVVTAKINGVTGEMVLTAAGLEISAGSTPVKITGTRTVGAALTAALQSGWSATGYQWTRSGVDISGATSNAYTLQSADAGTSVSCRVTGLSNLAAGIAITAAVVGAFNAQAVAIENDLWIQKSAALAGVTNSTTASFSFWFVPLADSTSFRQLKGDANSRCRIELDSARRLRVTVSNGADSFVFRTVSEFRPTDAESHIAISLNTNAAAGLKTGMILRNGVSDVEIFADTSPVFTPTFNVGQMIGSAAAGGSPCSMTLREFMWWPGSQIDWTVPATLAKVNVAGMPADPGSTGALVTGTAPAIYLSLRGDDLPNSFMTNRGTGGDFSQATGLPMIRADTPFIPYGDSLTFGTGATISPTDTWVYKTTRGLNTKRRRFNFGAGGESATAIRLRFVAAIAGHVTAFPKAIYSIEGGYNSIANGSASILTDFTLMRNAMLAADPSARHICIGIPNGNVVAGEEITGSRGLVIAAANTALAALFGANFIDIRQWLIDNGLAAAGLTAGADDLADIAAGIVPRQLRMADTSVHWSDAGQIAVGIAVRAKMQALGYD